eukprot:1536443-Rhodomonas_salina.1
MPKASLRGCVCEREDGCVSEVVGKSVREKRERETREEGSATGRRQGEIEEREGWGWGTRDPGKGETERDPGKGETECGRETQANLRGGGSMKLESEDTTVVGSVLHSHVASKDKLSAQSTPAEPIASHPTQNDASICTHSPLWCNCGLIQAAMAWRGLGHGRAETHRGCELSPCERGREGGREKGEEERDEWVGVSGCVLNRKGREKGIEEAAAPRGSARPEQEEGGEEEESSRCEREERHAAQRRSSTTQDKRLGASGAGIQAPAAYLASSLSSSLSSFSPTLGYRMLCISLTSIEISISL